jgi:7 transmembrane sweet-taste receptor of 3 GCPR
VGSCVMENDSISILAFAGPIMGFHLMLLIGTNCLLYSVRNVADRYQEQKYIAMASVLMFEILVVGIPVMVAVNDSPVATHIILVGIIAVSDIGTLCFTFIPKILFQRSGLEEGVSFGESILRSTHRLASMRESALRQNGESLYHCGPSTEFSRRMVRESNNDSIGEIREGPRIQSTSRRNLLHENIAEEDAKDVAEEQPQSDLNTICMDDQGGHLCQARIMQRAAEKGVMEQSERKSNERSQATSENEIVDDQRCAEPASLVNEHERMMKMTAKLMEEHEQMMKTTASILSEQEKYRSWLLDEEGKTKGAPKDEEGKVERRLSPSAPIPRVIETSTDDECGKDRGDVINPTRYQSEVTEMTEDTSKEYTAEKKKVAKTMREYSADLNGDHSD